MSIKTDRRCEVVVHISDGSSRQRQADLRGFEATVFYREGPGLPGLHKETLSQKTKTKTDRHGYEASVVTATEAQQEGYLSA